MVTYARTARAAPMIVPRTLVVPEVSIIRWRSGLVGRWGLPNETRAVSLANGHGHDYLQVRSGNSQILGYRNLPIM